MLSDAFVRGIRGPIGSGKSVACCIELMRRAGEQQKAEDGIAYTRWAITRNTYVELKATTIKTWHDWIPQGLGRWQAEGPPTHHIKTDTMDAEFMFLALDRPEDVRKLLSFEITGAWMNEAREAPKAILDGLTGRVGRYPSKRKAAATWRGIVMDTNSPETDHWWYVLAERDTSSERNRQFIESMDKAEAELRQLGLLQSDQPLMQFFSQPGGNDEKAENIDNLEPGYYIRSAAGKSDDWVKVYVNADYGYVQDGKPVYPEYRDSVHCQECEFVPGLPIYVGIDFGLTPAATLGQRMVNGRWNVIDEVVTEDMGAVRFAETLSSHLAAHYPGASCEFIGDPAGDSRAQTDEQTPFQILRANGIDAYPAPTNDPIIRREAVAKPMTRLIDGMPGLVISPRCQTLRKGKQGAYKYKRVAVAGAEKYRDEPDKGKFSHVADAEQYMMVGAGEGAQLIKRPGKVRKLKYDNRGRV